MLSKIRTAMNLGASGPSPWVFPVNLPEFGVMRFTQAAASNSNDDAYLLVMLADQACCEGREHQAVSLVEAAYSAFDREPAND